MLRLCGGGLCSSSQSEPYLPAVAVGAPSPAVQGGARQRGGMHAPCPVRLMPAAPHVQLVPSPAAKEQPTPSLVAAQPAAVDPSARQPMVTQQPGGTARGEAERKPRVAHLVPLAYSAGQPLSLLPCAVATRARPLPCAQPANARLFPHARCHYSECTEQPRGAAGHHDGCHSVSPQLPSRDVDPAEQRRVQPVSSEVGRCSRAHRSHPALAYRVHSHPNHSSRQLEPPPHTKGRGQQEAHPVLGGGLVRPQLHRLVHCHALGAGEGMAVPKHPARDVPSGIPPDPTRQRLGRPERRGPAQRKPAGLVCDPPGPFQLRRRVSPMREWG
mmetsp:Transcript_29705/g.95944  ORF Transcript_29705/g.95944 Transcript_29705/m.95944 type:complete len:328 (+) Transcript_29705:508-1491(+)